MCRIKMLQISWKLASWWNWDRFIQKDVSANIICLVEEQTDNEAVYSIERVKLIKRKQYYSKFFRIILRLQRIINIRNMNIDLYRTLSNPHVVKAEGKAFSHTRVFLNPYPPYWDYIKILTFPPNIGKPVSRCEILMGNCD